MRKGVGVALIMGIAMVLVAGVGLAVNAGDTSNSTGQRKARQLGLLRKVRAMEPPPSTLHQGQFQRTALQTSATTGQGIQSTTRISIPFGFAAPLMLGAGGQNVRVAGHGGCTADQQVTVQVTLTQTSTAALTTAQTQEVCTGVLQSWSTTAVAMTDVAFVAEPVQACGVAETREGEAITDRFEWCREVDLVHGLYMPLVFHN